MKTTILKKASKDKIGYLHKNGVRLEPREEYTFNYLTLFGFNIEVIRPTNIQNMKNPDILISGGVWEVKTPTSYKENSIRNRFREASDQAGRIVFDLRCIKKETDKVETQITKLFRGNGNVRRMIIIRKNGDTLELSK